MELTDLGPDCNFDMAADSALGIALCTLASMPQHPRCTTGLTLGLIAAHIFAEPRLDNQFYARGCIEKVNAALREPRPAQTAPDLPDPAASDPEVRRAVEREALEKRTKKLADLIASEREDPEWSPGAKKLLTQAYSVPALAKMKYTSRCGQTLCRVDYSFGSETDAVGGVQAMMVQSPWDGYVFIRAGDDKKSGSFYYMRNGYGLPD